MPNHVDNIIKISGTKESVDRVMDRIFVTEDYIQEIKKRNEGLDEKFQISIPNIGGLSFNRLVPKPTNVFRGEISDFEEQQYEDENWNISNWGTKWDAYNVKHYKSSDKALRIFFTTAWSPPIYYLEKLAEVCIQEGCKMRCKFEELCIDGFQYGQCYIDSENKLCIVWPPLEEMIDFVEFILFTPTLYTKTLEEILDEFSKENIEAPPLLKKFISTGKNNIWSTFNCPYY